MYKNNCDKQKTRPAVKTAGRLTIKIKSMTEFKFPLFEGLYSNQPNN
jgi:hypothetical protein